MMNIIPFPQEVKYKEGFLYPPYDIKKELAGDSVYGEEGYSLIINGKGIFIVAKTEAGLFYGDKTLYFISKQYGDKLPYIEIFDKPLYSYRGFMLDCSRHFFTAEEIKKQIDILALLKLNIFHWHLTDDQGWRVEIKKYPLLTEKGGKRAQTRGDGKPVEGFYTRSEISDIIDYCAERFINVVPEIDMPGHFKAAISSYPFLSCTGKEIKVGESFGVSPEIACAGKESTYKFCYDVLDEIMEMFPYKYIHLGGDEALKLRWLGCPDCQNVMKQSGLSDEEKLQGYFMTKMVAYVNSKGKKAINWNDGMLGGNIGGDIAVQYWKESKICKEVVEEESKRGRNIIYSPFFSFYLDYPHGMTPLKKTYNYKINNNFPDNILGVEAPLWTEYVDNLLKLEKMIYPRLAALAENGWSVRKDYKGFLKRLASFVEILNKNGIEYEKDANPDFFKGKFQIVKFFLNTKDKGLMENLKAMSEAKKKIKLKYKK